MEFEEGNIYFNKIIIIQSLSDEERKTGTEIHDDTISRRLMSDSNLSAEIIDVNTKSELISLLTRIKRETKELNLLPFIHIETHGSHTGIILKNRENVSWKDIIPVLREINILTSNNLFVSVSSCWGGSIQFEVEINKPCPFRGFIGPMNEIYPNDLLESFTIFFDELLLSNDFEKAISMLNVHNKSGAEFHHLNSESFFYLVIENYKKDLDLKSSRTRKIVDQFWENINSKAKLIYKSKSEFTTVVEQLTENISPKSYNKMKNQFLHIK